MTDTALAQLRHLYQNMVNGAVRDTTSAKRIAEGLLALAIEALERGDFKKQTMSAPTDAEIAECIEAARIKCVHPDAETTIGIARAVLAKWGTPPTVAGEPVAWMGMHDRTDLYYRKPPQADVVPLYTTPQPTQAQARAVPLTDDEALDAFCHTPGIHQFVQAFMAGVRFAEQHHGIKGGQHGTDI